MNDEEPIVPQEEQVITDPGYSYEELHMESARDIASNTDEPEEEKPVVEEEKPEEVVTPEEPPIDQTELIQKTADETVAKVIAEQQRIAEENKPEEPKKDEYDQFVEDFNGKEGRVPNWKEVAEWVGDRAKESLKAEQQAQIDEQKQQETARQEVYDKELKRVNEVIDAQLDDLYATNKLTKIVDPNSSSDQGIVERRALFEALQEKNKQIEVANEQRAREGKPLFPAATLKEVYYDGYVKPNAQPAGVDAPVSASRNATVSPSDEPEIDYVRDIKGNGRRGLGRFF